MASVNYQRGRRIAAALIAVALLVVALGSPWTKRAAIDKKPQQSELSAGIAYTGPPRQQPGLTSSSPGLQPPLDVLTELGPPPPVTVVGAISVVTLTVRNRGPAPIPGAALTVALAAGLRLDAITADRGNCIVTEARCVLGVLEAGAVVNVTLSVVGLAAGTWQVTALLVSAVLIDHFLLNTYAVVDLLFELPLLPPSFPPPSFPPPSSPMPTPTIPMPTPCLPLRLRLRPPLPLPLPPSCPPPMPVPSCPPPMTPAPQLLLPPVPLPPSCPPSTMPMPPSTTPTPPPASPPPDPALAVAVQPDPSYVGGTATATYTVRNDGGQPATGLRLMPGLPAGMPVRAAPPGCDATGCALGDLPPGGVAVVQFVLAPNAPGNADVSGVLTTTGSDSNPADNTAGSVMRVLQPTIVAVPSVGKPGFVTLVRGVDFPPGAPVRLRWTVGITAAAAPTVPRPDGTFAAQLLILPKDQIGPRMIMASGDGFDPVMTPFLVVAGSVQPPDFVVRD